MKKALVIAGLFIFAFMAIAQDAASNHFTPTQIKKALAKDYPNSIGQIPGLMDLIGKYIYYESFTNGAIKEGDKFFLAFYVFQINSSDDGTFQYFCYPIAPGRTSEIDSRHVYLLLNKGRIAHAVRYGRIYSFAIYRNNWDTTTSNADTGETIKIAVPVFDAQQAVNFISS